MQTTTHHGLQGGGRPAASRPKPAGSLDGDLGRLAGEAADIIIEQVEDIQARVLVAKNFAAMVALALLQRGVAR